MVREHKLLMAALSAAADQLREARCALVAEDWNRFNRAVERYCATVNDLGPVSQTGEVDTDTFERMRQLEIQHRLLTRELAKGIRSVAADMEKLQKMRNRLMTGLRRFMPLSAVDDSTI